MSVSVGNDNNLDAWIAETDLAVLALEHLEEAQYLAKKLSGATEACRDIDDAIYSLSGIAARAALKANRLARREDA